MASTTVKVSDLFDVGYGTKLDFKQMQVTSASDPEGIDFVSRSSRNLGVVARVKKYRNVEPLPAGKITVTLGGTYLLSAFVQEHRFYTGQNIAVLTPKREMSNDEKLFYCMCLGKNRFKYSAFGREANRTLKAIEIPAKPPRWLSRVVQAPERAARAPLSKHRPDLSTCEWKWHSFDDLFTIEKGVRVVNNDLLEGSTPLIRPIEINNGIDVYVNLIPNQKGNTITVSYNGSVGEAFYQPNPYFAVDDINVLIPKFEMNVFSAMFLLPLIRREKYRFSFGRKWNLLRMRKSRIKLPVAGNGAPDWNLMERYIKSLPYSAALLAPTKT